MPTGVSSAQYHFNCCIFLAETSLYNLFFYRCSKPTLSPQGSCRWNWLPASTQVLLSLTLGWERGHQCRHSWCHKAGRHLGDTVIVFDGTGRCKHSDRLLCLNTHWLSRVCNWNSIQHVKTRTHHGLTHTKPKNEISSTSLSQLMNSKKKHTKVLTNPASRGMICVYSDDWKYLHCNVV